MARKTRKKIWEQIADQLREDILTGKYKPGEELPTNLDLMKKYGTHSVTVQQAVNALIAEGLIITAGAISGGLFTSRPIHA